MGAGHPRPSPPQNNYLTHENIFLKSFQVSGNCPEGIQHTTSDEIFIQENILNPDKNTKDPLHYPHHSPATDCHTLTVLDQEGGWGPLPLSHPVAEGQTAGTFFVFPSPM